MKKLLIVYPGYNEEIELTQDIIETESGYVANTNEAPKWKEQAEVNEIVDRNVKLFKRLLDEEMRPYDLNTTKIKRKQTGY